MTAYGTRARPVLEGAIPPLLRYSRTPRPRRFLEINRCGCDVAHGWGTWSSTISPAASPKMVCAMRQKMKGLLTGTLIACVTIVLVTVAIMRHVNHKQDVAWCYDHGYANYATTDGFCVGTGGKLIKVGL